MGMVQTYQECFIHTLYFIKGMVINEIKKKHCVSSYTIQYNSKHDSIAIYMQ